MGSTSTSVSPENRHSTSSDDYGSIVQIWCADIFIKSNDPRTWYAWQDSWYSRSLFFCCWRWWPGTDQTSTRAHSLKSDVIEQVVATSGWFRVRNVECSHRPVHAWETYCFAKNLFTYLASLPERIHPVFPRLIAIKMSEIKTRPSDTRAANQKGPSRCMTVGDNGWYSGDTRTGNKKRSSAGETLWENSWYSGVGWIENQTMLSKRNTCWESRLRSRSYTRKTSGEVSWRPNDTWTANQTGASTGVTTLEDMYWWSDIAWTWNQLRPSLDMTAWRDTWRFSDTCTVHHTWPSSNAASWKARGSSSVCSDLHDMDSSQLCVGDGFEETSCEDFLAMCTDAAGIKK